MMNLPEAVQSDFVILKPGMMKVIGLELPQERTEQESKDLEHVAVSLLYHGYRAMQHEDVKGQYENENPIQIMLYREEWKGQVPSADYVHDMLNAELCVTK